VTLFKQRVDAGGASQPELYLAQSSLKDAKLKSIEIVARVSVDRNILSAALGVPVLALDGVTFSWPQFDSPAWSAVALAYRDSAARSTQPD
jgi:hypothetical protein